MKMANVKRMMMYSVNDTVIVRKSLEIGVLPIGLEPCTLQLVVWMLYR